MTYLDDTNDSPFLNDDPTIDLPADATWRDLCFRIISAHGGAATKKQLEAALQGHPKTIGKRFWTYAVSQTVQRDPRLIRATRGVWALRERFSPEDQARLDEQRRKECPLHGPRKKD